MRWLKTLRLRFRSLFRRADVDYELTDELQFHLDHLIATHVARGVNTQEARRLALVEMGGLEQQREACQDTRGIGAIEAVSRDVRFAVRGLRRTPGFTATIVASLALAIALLTTSFSVVNAYLLRSMPVPAADRLYHVWHAPPGQQEPEGVSTLEWSGLTDVVELADSSTFARYYLTGGGYTQELFGLVVARQSVEGLNVRAITGRTLEPADFSAGPTNVLIGESLWRARFGSPEAALGQTLQVSPTTQGGVPVTLRIVGVLSPDFRYAREFSRSALDIVAPQQRPTGRAYMVRLREGASPAVAEARITDAIRRIPGIKLGPEWPGVTLESVRDRYVKPVRPVLVSVMVASTLVLLIVTANVAILTLLRALRRKKEVAVRLALGAAKRHLVRAIVVEATVISSAALVAGLTISSWIVRALGPQIELQLGKPAPGGAATIGLDWVTVTVAVSVCLFVALALSFVPLFIRQSALADDLRRDGRTATDGRFARWTRSALITVEVAGSIALLVGCGLMVRTALTLLNTDLGMNPRGVVRSRIALPVQGYPDDAAFMRFYDRLSTSLATEARATIGMTDWPLFLEPARPLRIELDRQEQGSFDSHQPLAQDRSSSAAVTAVNAGYLTTLGIQVLDGRNFSETDRAAGEPVALASETLARRLWLTGSPIGQRIRARERLGQPIGPWRTVVGVVSDVRQTPADEDKADLYIPFAQVPARYAPILIRSDRPLSEWLQTLRTTVGAIDPAVLVSPPTSLETEWDKQLAGSRFLASLLTGFAVFAALVTLVGLYGITAYTVRQREPEVAIRMALGATRRQVVSLFMNQAAWVIAVGCLLGIGGAALVARTLERQLHGVTPFDAATVAGASVFMALAAFIATWWPAKRAARQNPSAFRDN